MCAERTPLKETAHGLVADHADGHASTAVPAPRQGTSRELLQAQGALGVNLRASLRQRRDDRVSGRVDDLVGVAEELLPREEVYVREVGPADLQRLEGPGAQHALEEVGASQDLAGDDEVLHIASLHELVQKHRHGVDGERKLTRQGHRRRRVPVPRRGLHPLERGSAQRGWNERQERGPERGAASESGAQSHLAVALAGECGALSGSRRL